MCYVSCPVAYLGRTSFCIYKGAECYFKFNKHTYGIPSIATSLHIIEASIFKTDRYN